MVGGTLEISGIICIIAEYKKYKRYTIRKIYVYLFKKNLVIDNIQCENKLNQNKVMMSSSEFSFPHQSKKSPSVCGIEFVSTENTNS